MAKFLKHPLRATPPNRNSTARPLRYETLEDRRMLAVVTVTTDQDVVDFNDGLTSLREAIFATNLVEGADEIQFDFGHDGPATILLTQGELAISDSLTITGSGAELLTIDAQRKSRIFRIGDGSIANISTVKLVGITLTHGVNWRNGGAISSGENLEIIDSRITDNSAGTGGDSELSAGGGIKMFSGKLTVLNSEISNNRSIGQGSGGGVSISSSTDTARFIRSTIRGNTARTGGGISSSANQLILSETRIEDNRARVGGGLFVFGGVNLPAITTAVVDSSITGNHSDDLGGGMYVNTHRLTIVNSTISENTTNGFGGGIVNTSWKSNSSTSISHSTIVENNADGLGLLNNAIPNLTSGGGFFSAFSQPPIIEFTDTLIARNLGREDAPSDLFVTSPESLNLKRSLISDNSGSSLLEAPIGSPDANGNLIGGPVHGVIDPLLAPLADNGGPTQTHALLPGSPAINAGDLNATVGIDDLPQFDQRGDGFDRVVSRIDIGAYEVQEVGDLNLLVDTLVDESDGDFSRGDLSLREAIELANANPVADTIRFDPIFTAIAGPLPATILLTMGELLITDSVEIVGLGAELLTIDASPTGDTIFVIDDNADAFSDVQLTGLKLTGSQNSAIRSREDLTVTSSILAGNRGVEGGAINVSGIQNQLSDAILIIRDSIITDNYATGGDGGGVYFRGNSAPLIIERSEISDNQASGRGGGVFSVGFLNVMVLENNVIHSNTAQEGAGLYLGAVDNIGRKREDLPIIYSFPGLASVVSNTISNNLASGDGGGIHIHTKTVSIVDSTVRGNFAGDNRGGGIFADGRLMVSSSSVVNNVAGSGGGIYIDDPTTITDSTISGNSAVSGAGGGVFSGHITTISNTTISNNSASSYGGGIAGQFSSITIANSSILGNTARDVGGGGVYVIGSLTNIIDSTISGNSTGGEGGGIQASGKTTITTSTISDNSAGTNGGGISANRHFPPGPTTITNSTVSGNSARNNGGGIWSRGTTTIASSTITKNVSDADRDGSGFGGGLFAYGRRHIPSLDHTIIAGNHDNSGTADDIAIAGIVNSSYSLIGSGAEFLGPLADNGGLTQTHALLSGSPAINTGDLNAIAGVDDVPLFDQRGDGFDRIVSRIDIGAYEVQELGDLNLLVDTLVDESDGDFSRGDLSLREAIELANANPVPDTIRFDPIFTALAGPLPATILLTMGELLITDSVEIVGLGAELLTIDASGNDPTPDENNGDGSRVFRNAEGLISGLTLTGGDVDQSGGALTGHGSLRLEGVHVIENFARFGGGLSLAARGNDSIEIISSVVAQNHTRRGRGGGISMELSEIASMSLLNSTIEGNTTSGTTAPGGGAYIINRGDGDIRISGVSVSGNSTRGTGAEGGGFVIRSVGEGDVSITDSTIKNNWTDGTSANGGGFLISHSGEGDVFIAGNSVTNNIADGTSAEGGGMAVFHLGHGTLTVIDNSIAGNGSERDSHGVYVVAGDGATAHLRSNRVVNNLIPDITDGFGGISTVALDGGSIFIEDNYVAGNLGGIHVIGPGWTEVNGNIIENNRSTGLVVSTFGGTVHTNHNSVSGNQSVRYVGGGLSLGAQKGGVITVVNTSVSGNNTERAGGGVRAFVRSGGAIEIRNSTISGNHAIKTDNPNSGFGGGIYIRNEGGQLTLLQTTISSNYADTDGGGLWVRNPNADEVTVIHSTITNNIADADSKGLGSGGGIFGEPTTLDHTIVVGNHDNSGVAQDIAGVVNSNFSLIGFGAQFLGPLADNGGLTFTHALLPGSPAINAGDPDFQQGDPSLPEFDQRGAPFARVVGRRIDIGAFESQPDVGTFDGDFDADGDVDGSDFLNWQRNFGRIALPTQADGDASGNGIVDGNDLAVWQATYGEALSAASLAENIEADEDAAQFTQAVDLVMAKQLLDAPSERSHPRPSLHPTSRIFDLHRPAILDKTLTLERAIDEIFAQTGI